MKYHFCVISLVFGLAAPLAAQDHSDVVRQVAAEGAPDHTLEGALSFTLRVVSRLNALYPQEHAGLLEKLAGESIIPYGGTLVSASRIAEPPGAAAKRDGRLSGAAARAQVCGGLGAERQEIK